MTLRLALIATGLNVALVVSGGVVRLTGSGLGCPTWPRCTVTSMTSMGIPGIHGHIEFVNRMIAITLEAIGLALLHTLRRHRRAVPPSWWWLAVAQTLVVPLQAVVGGLLVLTHLAPTVRLVHFMATFPICWASVALLRRLRDAGEATRQLPSRAFSALARASVAIVILLLLAGAVVSGAGPYTGSPNARPLPFAYQTAVQAHTHLVWLEAGVLGGLAVLACTEPACQRLRLPVAVLCGLFVGQGLIGYVQYATHEPRILVASHMFGAAVLFVWSVWLQTSTTVSRAPIGSAQSHESVSKVAR